MKTKSTNYIHLEFLSRSANEAFARGAAACFAAQLDPTLEELGDIKTAVSEAVTNAIVHAYPDSLGKIVMRARILEGDVLEITIRDWGRGIPDVDKARQPLYTTGGEERSGMGFTIMESFMDRLTVRSSQGKGTRVAMSRRIRRRRTVLLILDTALELASSLVQFIGTEQQAVATLVWAFLALVVLLVVVILIMRALFELRRYVRDMPEVMEDKRLPP